MSCFFLLFFFFYSLSSSSGEAFVDSQKSIYDLLLSHGLPKGLLPKGVSHFSVDEGGRFEAYLDQACNARFESELHYDRNVSGKLSFGQIASLSGVSAQELFLWFPVQGIHVDVPSSGLIYFDVGVAYKQFSLSSFESPPDCTAVRSIDFPVNEETRPLVYKDQYGKLRFLPNEESLVKALLNL